MTPTAWTLSALDDAHGLDSLDWLQSVSLDLPPPTQDEVPTAPSNTAETDFWRSVFSLDLGAFAIGSVAEESQAVLSHGGLAAWEAVGVGETVPLPTYY